MRCHWSHDDKGIKFWLPQCMGGAVYGPHGCHCYDWRKDDPEKHKEKERKQLILDQQKEIANLNRIIRNLTKSK